MPFGGKRGQLSMIKEVFIRFLDGTKAAGFLPEPFDPDSETFTIRDLQQKIQQFSLVDVSYIKFLGSPELPGSFGDDEIFEDLQTLKGEEFHVRLKKNTLHRFGFFAHPTDSHCDYFTIFFTVKGLKRRQKDKPIGEFLKRMGFVTSADVDQALEDQKKLRSRRLGEIISDRNRVPQEHVDQVIRSARTGSKHSNIRVGDILIEAGLVTKQQVDEALKEQEKGKRKRIGQILIDKGLITEHQLLTALARKFGLRIVDLEKTPPDPEAIKSLPREIIEKMQVLPVETGPGRLVVATSTPTDPTISENLRFATERHIEMVVASAAQISDYLNRYFEVMEDSVEELIGELDGEDVVLEESREIETVTESDSKVINLVNKVLIDGFRRGASDIHFEPGLGPQPLRIRYRKDGVCFTVHQIAPAYKAAIVSRIKIIAKLDIAERRRPQSGKILLKRNHERIEYRVEIMPTIGGQEDAVLRILNAAHIFPLDKLGFSDRNLVDFRTLLSRPYGMILCVGPTGSGKTTTLHSGLAEINGPDRKIWTAEDPVEITQNGLRQVQINAKIGLTFEQALRSFLRADPDVIMIGEMRDTATAKTAIGAALTGHLVFSTLHTNNAPETVTRLLEMGLDPYNFSDSMLGIVAQRLVLRLCSHCRTAYTPSRPEYDELVTAYGPELFEQDGLPAYSEELQLMKATGCAECQGLGYSGRLAVQELLMNSAGIRKAIKQNLSVDDLRGLAIEGGMRTLRMDGIQKIFAGLTDFSQLNRVVV